MTRVPRRVVLADGSALGGPLVARMLADTGAVVTHAKDAGALLSAVADSPPSLAVIDLESLGGSDVAFADALASMGYEGLVVFLTRSSTFRSAVAGSRTLPKPVLPRSLAAAVERRDPAGPPDVLDGPRLRFLLAEDDEINQLLAVSALEKAGHAVEVVSTGTDAVRRAVEGAFDVVLMDVHLPHLSGPDATREIRRLRAGSERPLAVVALTAAGEGSGDRERCLAAGMNAFATKPLNLASLRKILDALGVG